MDLRGHAAVARRVRAISWVISLDCRRDRSRPVSRPGWVACEMRSTMATRHRGSKGGGRRRGVPAARAGSDHRAGQQARQLARAGEGRDRAAVLVDLAAPAAGVRHSVVAACAARVREPGFSKERRLDRPADHDRTAHRRGRGFPLTVNAFEGSQAETATGACSPSPGRTKRQAPGIHP